MKTDKIEDKLKQAFDMAIFSRLLEMDDDEGRGFSSSSLYIFIEIGENTLEDMVEALSRRDLLQLILLGGFLKKSASVRGLYRVRNCCENIQRYGTMTKKSGPASETVEGSSFGCIEDEIGSLRDSLCFARRAIDEFYETETIMDSD